MVSAFEAENMGWVLVEDPSAEAAKLHFRACIILSPGAAATEALTPRACARKPKK